MAHEKYFVALSCYRGGVLEMYESGLMTEEMILAKGPFDRVRVQIEGQVPFWIIPNRNKAMPPAVSDDLVPELLRGPVTDEVTAERAVDRISPAAMRGNTIFYDGWKTRK